MCWVLVGSDRVLAAAFVIGRNQEGMVRFTFDFTGELTLGLELRATTHDLQRDVHVGTDLPPWAQNSRSITYVK